jgi:hypothetical protein
MSQLNILHDLSPAKYSAQDATIYLQLDKQTWITAAVQCAVELLCQLSFSHESSSSYCIELVLPKEEPQGETLFAKV